MKTDFLKRPRNIVLLVFIVVYFLPFTPFFKAESEYLSVHVTGWEMLINKARVVKSSGDVYPHLSRNIEEELYENSNSVFEPKFGLLDKLTVLIVLAALLILFNEFQLANQKPPFLDDMKLAWINTLMIGLVLIIFPRYCFDTDSTKATVGGYGAWIYLLGIIFLAFEQQILSLFKKS